jgi:hypothetical protein
MADPAQFLSNPVVAVSLRLVLGGYVIFMSRRFYSDPTGYFRKSLRGAVDLSFLAPLIRGLALFCLWGGCFIVATAVAVQILGLHGDLLAVLLITLSAVAAWLLLPKQVREGAEDSPEV